MRKRRQIEEAQKSQNEECDCSSSIMTNMSSEHTSLLVYTSLLMKHSTHCTNNVSLTKGEGIPNCNNEGKQHPRKDVIQRKQQMGANGRQGRGSQCEGFCVNINEEWQVKELEQSRKEMKGKQHISFSWMHTFS